MFASRLRVASARLALLKPALVKTTLPSLCVPRLRHYATDNKQVSYTVDKFPGYIRNPNFKQVK